MYSGKNKTRQLRRGSCLVLVKPMSNIVSTGPQLFMWSMHL